jgi:hypothetical protein
MAYNVPTTLFLWRPGRSLSPSGRALADHFLLSRTRRAPDAYPAIGSSSLDHLTPFIPQDIGIAQPAVTQEQMRSRV